jgi:hypothetical protein
MSNSTKAIFFCLFYFTAASTEAAPVPVYGSLLVGGQYETTLSDTTITDISINTVWANGATGNIVGTVDIFTPQGTGATASLTSFIPVNDFISVGGWSLDINTLNVVDTGNILDLEGTGILSHIDYVSTNVTWSFSAESATNYSMSITAVPVPAAIWLFGSGLLGLIAVARRKAG